MHTITFSLHYEPPANCIDTARDVIRDIHHMSTQTKARIELSIQIVLCLLTLAGALKVFVFMPPRVDALEKAQEAHAADIKAIQIKASATDVAIAGIVPQLNSINQGVSEIKADMRDLRNKP